ncbi:hypothetical protein J6590_084278 [Homalodisca vitripennis]|nr:hypothetical protein J6590_084278 [Homalodisca vitripennis]
MAVTGYACQGIKTYIPRKYQTVIGDACQEMKTCIPREYYVLEVSLSYRNLAIDFVVYYSRNASVC